MVELMWRDVVCKCLGAVFLLKLFMVLFCLIPGRIHHLSIAGVEEQYIQRVSATWAS